MDLSALFQFGGRLHPMLLHAPIGLAIGLLAVEVLAIVRRKTLPKEVRSALVWLTALSAVGAAATGLILSREGGHNADTVDLHQWLGIGVAAAALVAAFTQQAGRRVLYALSLLVTAGLLVPAGHFGSTMTHGANFLTEPFEPPTPPPLIVETPPGEQPTAGAFATVASILDARCASCHGADRHKGGLSLHTPDAITRGGDRGPVVVPGDPGASDLLHRMRLPVEHDDHMPPTSKPQPTPAEIDAIEAWIAAGAKFDAPTPTPALPPQPKETPRPAAAPISQEALAALRAALVHAEPVSRDSKLLVIDFSAVAAATDDAKAAALLRPLRDHIAELTLARSAITDASGELFASMPKLTHLNVTATDFGDAGLAPLAERPALVELVLVRTKVTDAGLATLATLPALERVYLWGAQVTPDALASLRHDLPRVIVDAGDTPDAAALEIEKEITLRNEADAPAPPAPQAPAVDPLKPINDTCPVTGKPIDPEFAIVYKGKVVAFCCRHCLAQFLEDPAKFEDKLH